MTRIIRFICGGIMLVFAIGAGSISTYLNVSHGLETSLVAALTFLLADQGRIWLPMIASFTGWTKALRLIVLCCFLTSGFCAFQVYGDRQAAKFLSLKTGDSAISEARANYDAIRAELATVKVDGTVESLKALAESHNQKAKAESGRGFCGPLCKSAEKAYIETLALLAKAEKKAKLETKLEAAHRDLVAATNAKSGTLATLVAQMTGGNEGTISLTLGFTSGFLMLIMLEQLVYLGILGFMTIAPAIRTVSGGCPSWQEAHSIQGLEVAVQDTSKTVPLLPKTSRKEAALQKVVALILETEQGCLHISGRQLAKQLAIAPSTFAPWLIEWHNAGLLSVQEHNAHKKRITLGRAA